MALNLCACTGVLLRDPVTRFEGTTQQTTFTVRCDEVGRDGLTHPLYISVVCYSKVAEDAATLPVGAVLSVEGKLMWKKTTTKTGEAKSGLAVLARAVSVLVSPVPQEVS